MPNLIKQTWEEITILVALGGGFWYALEPPIPGPVNILSGFVCTAALAAALAVRASLQSWGTRRGVRTLVLMLAVVFLLAAVVMFINYVVARSNLVFKYPHEQMTIEVVRGKEYQQDVLEMKVQNGLTDSELLAAAGGIRGRDLVWTRESIAKAERRLAVGYVLSLLFTLLSTIFVVELLRDRRRPT